MDPSGALRHPIWWVALVLLVLNDHFFKSSDVLPRWLTGKLSDFAGIVVALPLLAVVAGVRNRCTWHACSALVGLGFCLLKTWQPVARLISDGALHLGISYLLRCDPWDLLALPALLVAPSHGFRRRTMKTHPSLGVVEPRGTWREFLFVTIGGLACLATGTVPPRSPEMERCFADGRNSVAPDGGDASTRFANTREQTLDLDTSFICANQVMYMRQGDKITATVADTQRVLFEVPIDCNDCRTQMAFGLEGLFVVTRRVDGTKVWARVFALDPGSGQVMWRREFEYMSPPVHDTSELGIPHYTHGRLAVPTPEETRWFDARTGETLTAR